MQSSYKQTAQLRENSYGTVTDTPELLHASYLKDIYSQVCEYTMPTLIKENVWKNSSASENFCVFL